MTRTRSPWRKAPLHSTGDASRLTALFLGRIWPICSLVTPCQPGASPVSVRRGVSPRTPGAALVVVVACAASAACGYSLAGRGAFLPDYIETIGIPMFDNETSAFEVEQLVTQEVRQEFIGRGRYRVVPDATGVDAVLEGAIRNIRIAPASFTDDQQASRYMFTLTARIAFTDLTTNEVLWQNPSLQFSDEYEVASGGGDVQNVSAFFGQRSNAVERIAQDFAETVVSSILEAF